MKATRQQIESELNRLREDAAVLHAALNDVLNGKVRWFKQKAGANRKTIHLGITRATGPAGGIVLVSRDGYACAYYWEKWFADIRDSIPGAGDKEAHAQRELAFQANTWVLEQQRPPQEVAA